MKYQEEGEIAGIPSAVSRSTRINRELDSHKVREA